MQVTAFSFFFIPKPTSTRMNRSIWHISVPHPLSHVCYRGLKNRPNTIKKKKSSPSTPVQAMHCLQLPPGPFACINQCFKYEVKTKIPKVGHKNTWYPFIWIPVTHAWFKWSCRTLKSHELCYCCFFFLPRSLLFHPLFIYFLFSKEMPCKFLLFLFSWDARRQFFLQGGMCVRS